MAKDKDTTALERTVQEVELGIASEQDSGLVMRSLKLAMAVRLSTGLSHVLQNIEKQSRVLNKAIDNYTADLNARIDDGSIEPEELLEYINSTQNKELQILELYRRVLQGNNMFEADSMSADEKLVHQMLRSFKTPEDKEKFFKMCRESHLFD